MTRKAAIHEVTCLKQESPAAGSHLVVLRWATRFGRPNWTIVSRAFAESQLKSRGAEEVRIEA